MWTLALKGATVIVLHVLQWEGHIAYDGASLSEIVVPIKDSKGKSEGY
jgi:putative methionine-R-sulfoxide reductase with GAF domain